MGEFKNQDKTGQTDQQDDKAAFGQFEKKDQQQQGEIEKQDELADKDEKNL